MQESNFHATIAFVPWNYDRSKPDVVALFRDNPDRLSICIHGNNHDHREFCKFKISVKDPWPAKPLIDQEADIRQALARMEEFKRLTELPYDHIMVFPHEIAPAKTLGLLKKYNFLATSNAGNIPLDSQAPPDELFELRPVTLAFENFASLNRFSAKGRTKVDIAIDLFFGRPLLFYGHHGLFKESINAFNKTAELVNHFGSHVQWRSLGYIAQHLYHMRMGEDGNYDVRSYSRRIEIENLHERALTYVVSKEESFSPPVSRVTVDGKPFPYLDSGKNLTLSLIIPAGESRLIEIHYENDLDLTSIDISKKDPHIAWLRKLSDFRDMKLSKNFFGRALIHLYYEAGLFKLSLDTLAIFLLLCTLFALSGICYVHRRLRKSSK